MGLVRRAPARSRSRGTPTACRSSPVTRYRRRSLTGHRTCLSRRMGPTELVPARTGRAPWRARWKPRCSAARRPTSSRRLLRRRRPGLRPADGAPRRAQQTTTERPILTCCSRAGSGTQPRGARRSTTGVATGARRQRRRRSDNGQHAASCPRCRHCGGPRRLLGGGGDTARVDGRSPAPVPARSRWPFKIHDSVRAGEGDAQRAALASCASLAPSWPRREAVQAARYPTNTRGRSPTARAALLPWAEAARVAKQGP